MKRGAGILLSVSSLPSKYGIGCFDECAYEFVDFLKESKQSFWQILPLGPTGYGDSPYQTFSVFAGNPYFISLKSLCDDGLLTTAECDNSDFGNNIGFVDYEKLYKSRYILLKKAYFNSDIEKNNDFKKFCESNEWLDDYALFMALKDRFGGAPLQKWASEIRLREPSAIEKHRDELDTWVHFYKFLQYCFFSQFEKFKAYANKNGVKIIGDIPIYTSADSADVWTHPELFRLDSQRIPTAVAGCPPDSFAPQGQLWGNPLYDWEAHRKSGYEWWISRIGHNFKLCDVLRIDHFRGFDEYYAIGYGEADALNGKWEKGPGIELFRAIEQKIGKREIIAEDLGFVTDSVKRLVSTSGFANMKVLEFAFDIRDASGSEHLPHTYPENCVAYTGTHDNQTLVSWLKTISEGERKSAKEYLCDFYTPNDKLNFSLISLIMRSRADVCIIPMQDWLGLDDASRMNTPSTLGKNWRWRMTRNDINEKLCDRIRRMTELYGR